MIIAVFTMADLQEVAYALSNGAIFSHLEFRVGLTQISRENHYSTLNVLETVRNTDS